MEPERISRLRAPWRAAQPTSPNARRLPSGCSSSAVRNASQAASRRCSAFSELARPAGPSVNAAGSERTLGAKAATIEAIGIGLAWLNEWISDLPQPRRYRRRGSGTDRHVRGILVIMSAGILALAYRSPHAAGHAAPRGSRRWPAACLPGRGDLLEAQGGLVHGQEEHESDAESSSSESTSPSWAAHRTLSRSSPGTDIQASAFSLRRGRRVARGVPGGGCGGALHAGTRTTPGPR